MGGDFAAHFTGEKTEAQRTREIQGHYNGNPDPEPTCSGCRHTEESDMIWPFTNRQNVCGFLLRSEDEMGRGPEPVLWLHLPHRMG